MPIISDLPEGLFTEGTGLSMSIMERTFQSGEDTSLDILNGKLDADNLSTDMLVHAQKVRPRSCVFGKMEGLTGNFDFHGQKVFTRYHTNTDAFVALPGACLSFYLPPEPPKSIVITWQVFGANAILFKKKEDNEGLTRMQFYINGTSTEGTRMVPSSRHGHNGYTPPTEGGLESTFGDAAPHRAWRRPHRDRVWSGHYVANIDAGGTSTVKPGWNHAWIGVHNDDQTARFRVRNMKAIWFF